MDLIYPLLTKALDCAVAALDPPPERVAVYPGNEVAWDDCCDGQVWSRLVSLAPTGSTTTQQARCGVVLWLVTLAVGSLRCAAVVDEQGHAPLPTALSADSEQMALDCSALMVALECCLAPQVASLRMLGWAPLGPQGGCVGGEWTFTVLMDNCQCEEVNP